MSKIADKIRSRKENEPVKEPITRANIEEHREKTLESAKKYKYPMQQAKHIILIGAAVVAFLAVVAFVVISWWQLYTMQTTSNFYYTATKVIPVAVADVDGEPVNYGGYLRRVRASLHYLEDQENRDFKTEDGLRELTHTKRANLDEAERSAFAMKIASEKNVAVSSGEVDANISSTLNSQDGGVISERAFESSLWRYYGWSLDDYRQIVRERLTVRKASFAIDATARARVDDILNQLYSGAKFEDVAKANSDDENTKANGGDAGTVGIGNVDNDGLIAAAKSLQTGQVSGVIEGVDAYYVIKLVEKNDSSVRYLVIKVALKEFNEQFDKLREQGKIQEYIKVSEES